MAQSQPVSPTLAAETSPAIRKISLGDLWDALAKGIDDFKAMPTHAIFLVAIYPVIGLFLARATMDSALLPLLYPLIGGFALIGPLAAIGLYEMSRRREKGLDAVAAHAFDIFKSPAIIPILELGAILMALFFVWLAAARSLYGWAFSGARPASFEHMVQAVLTTQEGMALIIAGNVVGAVFAALAFALTAVSFPLLLDRHVSLSVAVGTSVRAVLANPAVMAIWAFLIAAALFIGALPLFVGLIVVLPVLGHASWHLYRKVVV